MKIYATFWMKLPVSTPSDLQIWQELGEGSGHCLSKRRIANGSDLIAKVRVNCSREVDISLHNS